MQVKKRQDNEGRNVGSDIALEGREIIIKATFAIIMGVRMKQPRVHISRAGHLCHHHLALSNKVTLLPSGVLMTSLADHVHDPFCLCGKGEGWTAPLGLH